MEEVGDTDANRRRPTTSACSGGASGGATPARCGGNRWRVRQKAGCEGFVAHQRLGDGRLDRAHLLSYIFVVHFVWDKRKATANLEKHGVSFEEASSAFDDPLGAYYPDTLHDDRFILIGYSGKRRLLYVVHAEVEMNAIRIISARKASKHEKARYEND